MDIITDHMPNQRSEEEAGTVCICIFFLNVCMHVCTLHECSLPGGQKRALYSLELEMVRYHVDAWNAVNFPTLVSFFFGRWMYFILCACASMCVCSSHECWLSQRPAESFGCPGAGVRVSWEFKCVLGPKTLVLCAAGALKQLNQFPNPLLVSYLN